MIRIFLGWLAGLLIACVITVYILPADSVATSRTLAFICMALGVWAGVEWDARSK